MRRFEMGASAIGLDEFLRKRGYAVITNGGRYRLRTPDGKLQSICQRQLIAVLDAERVKAGLEPVSLRSAR